MTRKLTNRQKWIFGIGLSITVVGVIACAFGLLGRNELLSEAAIAALRAV